METGAAANRAGFFGLNPILIAGISFACDGTSEW